jgi:hypothetical protein
MSVPTIGAGPLHPQATFIPSVHARVGREQRVQVVRDRSSECFAAVRVAPPKITRHCYFPADTPLQAHFVNP